MTANVIAQDTEAIRAKLDTAKKSYEAELDKQQKDLLALLAKREEQARKDGNKKLIDQVIAERESFESKGSLPKSVSLMTYTSRIGFAKKTLSAAYDEAIKAYLRARNDKEAEALEAEKKEMLKGLTNGVDTKAELTRYLEGSEWLWDPKSPVGLGVDGVTLQPEWTKAGLTVKWTAVDRRTIVLTVIKGRGADRVAVLTLNEELTEMSGIGFEGVEFATPIKRRK